MKMVRQSAKETIVIRLSVEEGGAAKEEDARQAESARPKTPINTELVT